MGQKPVPPLNIPIPTKIGSKTGGEFTYQPKWDPKTVFTTTAKCPLPQQRNDLRAENNYKDKQNNKPHFRGKNTIALYRVKLHLFFGTSFLSVRRPRSSGARSSPSSGLPSCAPTTGRTSRAGSARRTRCWSASPRIPWWRRRGHGGGEEGKGAEMCRKLGDLNLSCEKSYRNDLID